MRKPRIGHIEFLNCFPLYYVLVKNNILWDVELIKGTPAQLNERLLTVANGRAELDICSVSSIVYAKNHRNLLLLPNLSISSEKEVMSVSLVSKKKIQELGGSVVALTDTSATSQILLKIILADKYNIRPRFIECAPNLEQMLTGADAALLIGDPALKINYQKPAGLHIYDLGKEWQELTGKNMVYGLWVVRREFALAEKELAQKISRTLAQAMDGALRDVPRVAQQAAKWESYPAEFLAEYFLTLKYIFTKPYQEGLLEYYRRAKAHNFLDDAPSLAFLEV